MNLSTTGINETPTPPRSRFAIVLLLSVMVLLFRVAAWFNPSSVIVIPPALGLHLNLLGMLFLACGVWAWFKKPSRLTRVFLLSSLGGGIHWGGSIASGNQGLETAFLFFYAGATALGDGAFLDLALHYPRSETRHGFSAKVFYLLGGLTLLAVPIAPFLSKQVVEAGLGLVILVAFMMTIAGGIVFLVKWFRASPLERREYALTLVVAALVFSTVVDLMAEQGLFPGPPEAWTLTYALTPLALAWAVTRPAVGPLDC